MFFLLSLPFFFKLRCSRFFLLCRSWTFILSFFPSSSAGNKSIRGGRGERRETTYGLKGIPYFNSTSPPLLPLWQAKMFRSSVCTHRQAKQMKPCAEDFSEYIETLKSSPQEERRTKEEKTGNSQSFAGFYLPFLKREKLCVWVSKKAWCFPLFSCILYFGGSFASERRLGYFFFAGR